MSSILLAVADNELRDAFADAIRAAPELAEHDLRRTGNFKGVSDALVDADDIDIVIIEYDLPPGGQNGNGEAANLPVNLVRTRVQERPRFLVLDPVEKSHRQQIDVSEHAEWMKTTEFFDRIDGQPAPFGISIIARMLASPGTAPVELDGGIIDLVIDKEDTMTCNTWLVEFGQLRRLGSPEAIHIDTGILEDLDDCTLNLSDDNQLNGEAYLRNYRSVGRKVRSLVNQNPQTRDAIRELISRAGGIDKVYVQFQMPFNKLLATPFEAILQCDHDDDQNDDFQLAFSPVYRIVHGADRFWSEIKRPTLSRQINVVPQQVSCLVINAAVSGPVDSIDGSTFPSLNPIESAKEETEKVIGIFREMQARGLVSNIDCINFESDAEKAHPHECLRRKLTSREWDIVHYNGHSLFESVEGGGRGHIFLPGKNKLARPVEIDDLADWCAGTSFVFMSSCQSAAPGFIQSLAGKGIPIILGYRWKVSADGAAQFAERFYHHFFEGNRIGHIEDAFSAAQKSMKTPEDLQQAMPLSVKPVWASSMLVMQNL